MWMTWGGEEAFSDSQALLADKMRAAGVLHESFVQPTMAHDALLAATLSFNFGLCRGRGDPHNFEASAAFIAMVKWIKSLGPDWLQGGRPLWGLEL